jgi:predicted HTH transcriptional regulator
MTNSGRGLQEMDEAEFEELLAQGHELSGVEYKGPGSRKDKPFAVRVARACLGMVNRRGGGIVIIGVAQKAQKPPDPIGLSPTDMLTWNYDEFSDTLSEYADPSFSFQLEPFIYHEKAFIRISISEFIDIPVLCKKDYKDILRKGACYVRTRRKPETTEIPSQEDMRDLLDLATEKRLRSFLAQAGAGGLLPSSSQQQSDDESFANQTKDLLG